MFRKIYNRLLKYFLIRNVLNNFAFRSPMVVYIKSYNIYVVTGNKVFSQSALYCLYVNYFSEVCVLPVIFNKLMSKFNLCFKFNLEVIHERLKFLCTPCWSDLGMLGQTIHSRKMGANLLQKTRNTEMWISRDQMRMRAKLIFTHIILDGLNRDWWL